MSLPADIETVEPQQRDKSVRSRFSLHQSSFTAIGALESWIDSSHLSDTNWKHFFVVRMNFDTAMQHWSFCSSMHTFTSEAYKFWNEKYSR